MADKSAFVPVDAIQNHKASDMDVDIDDELFGKKSAKGAKPSSPAAPAAEKPKSRQDPPPAAPKAGGFQYKKATNYQKTYAYAKK